MCVCLYKFFLFSFLWLFYEHFIFELYAYEIQFRNLWMQQPAIHMHSIKRSFRKKWKREYVAFIGMCSTIYIQIFKMHGCSSLTRCQKTMSNYNKINTKSTLKPNFSCFVLNCIAPFSSYTFFLFRPLAECVCVHLAIHHTGTYMDMIYTPVRPSI